jgi:Protein of unknown function (DUF3592)
MGNRGCIVAFLSLFLLVGIGTSFLFVAPAFKVLKAKSWPAVPCTILSSELGSHPGEDSTTYSVDVSYTYTFQGQEHKSDRYQFLGGSTSSGREVKERAVRRLPPLTRTVCYVNPDDPSEAVLNRDFSTDYFLAALVPLIFVGASLGAIVLTLRSSS